MLKVAAHFFEALLFVSPSLRGGCFGRLRVAGGRFGGGAVWL